MAVSPITASKLMPLRGDERWGYLSRAKTIRVATLNEDGTIYLSPLWLLVLVLDEKIYIPVDAASRHGANFEPGRALSALVDGGDEYATVNGVRILGRTGTVQDEGLIGRLRELVFDRYFSPGHPYADSYREFGEVAGRAYYELVPDKLIEWDMREVTTLAMAEARVLPEHVKGRLA